MRDPRHLFLLTRRCSVAGRPRSRRAAACALAMLAGLASPAAADDTQPLLQWFEARWLTMEARTPDIFMAGYGGIWIPPVSKCVDPNSAGFDVFDRFDLGSPASPTVYGTEAGLRALISELHRANTLVYVDSVMNHNAARSAVNAGFITAGGFPGFVLNLSGDVWGDFHDGSTQSTNPDSPNFNLWEGDLVGLIDIAQEKNYVYIRHPVAAGNPQNIPAGTIRNLPNPANTRVYPDLQLTPSPGIQEPGLPPNQFRNPATNQVWTFTQFNTSDPTAGDPVPENATGLLLRWTQWMMDDLKVDGFRLDAAKHVPPWFWNNLWDASVYRRRITPAGSRWTPFSFGEVVGGGPFQFSDYVRKDGFGNRDILDLGGAGALRDLLNAGGFGSWSSVLSAHADNIDGFNNGTVGVNHVYSHDNGSEGNGASIPALPAPEKWALPMNAYLLLRPGPVIVYHNSRELIATLPTNTNRFWPREGNPTALGFNQAAGVADANLTRLVRLAFGHARGEFRPISGWNPDAGNAPSNFDDVLSFERRTNLGGGNFVSSIVASVSDRNDGGYVRRTLDTSFNPGTRLHELTGAAADPVVNNQNAIAQTVTVGADRRITVSIPNNRNSAGVFHGRGYVAYGPAAPSGTLTLVGASTPIPADDASVPVHRRRLTPIDVIDAPSFTIRLQTAKTDPLDPDWDDNALFRIDRGFVDFNGNGGVDVGESSPTVPGYEQFLTSRLPIAGANPPREFGLYEQTIDTSLLDEGTHYLSVVAFRRRTDGGLPILTEFRRVFYVDRAPPQVSFSPPSSPVQTPAFTFSIDAPDRTVTRVHVLLNLPSGTDPRPLCNASNQASQFDRSTFRRTVNRLPAGANSATVVAFELSGRSSVTRYDNIVSVVGTGDVNGDASLSVEDLYTFATIPGYAPEADMDGNGTITPADRSLLELLLRTGELPAMRAGQRP